MRQLPNKSQEAVRHIGKVIEKAVTEPETKAVAEKYSGMRERFEKLQNKKEVLSDDTDLYVTAIADFVEDAYKPKLVATDVINSVSVPMSGSDSLKIPKANLLSAVDVNDDGTFPSEETTDWDSVTATIDYKGCYTSIPQQLIDKAAIDLLRERLSQLGTAISRKVDSDIVAELDTVTDPTGSYGDIGNYNYLGATTYIDYAKLVSGIQAARDNYAEPDTIVCSNVVWTKLMTDADFKDALGFGTTPQGSVPELQSFGGLKILPTTQVSNDSAYLIDSANCGYVVDGTGIKTYDGRVSNTIQQEVLAVKGYDVKIARPKSVYGIHGDEATPT